MARLVGFEVLPPKLREEVSTELWYRRSRYIGAVRPNLGFVPFRNVDYGPDEDQVVKDERRLQYAVGLDATLGHLANHSPDGDFTSQRILLHSEQKARTTLYRRGTGVDESGEFLGVAIPSAVAVFIAAQTSPAVVEEHPHSTYALTSAAVTGVTWAAERLLAKPIHDRRMARNIRDLPPIEPAEITVDGLLHSLATEEAIAMDSYEDRVQDSNMMLFGATATGVTAAALIL